MWSKRIGFTKCFQPERHSVSFRIPPSPFCFPLDMGTGPIYRWDEYPSKMQQAGGQRTGLWEEALIFRRGKGVDDEEEAEELPTVDAGEKAQQASQEQNS